MRIALCLSGQPRFLPEGLDQIKRNLLEPNGIEDVFIHAWKSEVFQSAQPHQSGKWSYHPETAQLLSSLNPKMLLIQENCPFQHLDHLENLPTAIQKNLASMFYSAWKCNELKRDHERLHGNYDLVIKTRTDINYHKPVILKDLPVDISAINVPEMYQSSRVSDSYPTKSGWSYSSLSDTFMIGSSCMMDSILTIGQDFERIHHEIWPYVYGEAFLGYQARGVLNLPVKMLDIRYNLFR